MKNTLNYTLNLFLLTLWALSCGPQKGDSEFVVVEGHWGHLQNITQTTPTKMYLSHVKKTQTYKVCLARYMAEKYTGIENEVVAAINIWGHYVGRTIQVEVLSADLAEPSPYQDEIAAMEAHYKVCPKDTDLVMAEVFPSSNYVGLTQTSYSYRPRNGKQEITNFKRLLFLRTSDPEADEIDGEDRVVWKSLSQVLGKELTSEEILEMMKKRDQKVYLTGKDELLTLKTIVHEFGHIWGLCDQYALEGDLTNCDPRFSTIDAEGHIILNDDSTMAKSSWAAKLYLTDDDIEGIRQLGSRKHFSHDWPEKEEFMLIPVPDVAKEAPVPVAQLNTAKMEGTTVVTDLTLVTTVPQVTIKVKMDDKRGEDLIEFSDIVLRRPLSSKTYKLNLNVGRYVSPLKVKLTIVPPQGENIQLEKEILRNSSLEGNGLRSTRIGGGL